MKLFCKISKELLSTWKGALGALLFFIFLDILKDMKQWHFSFFAATDRKWGNMRGWRNEKQRRESGTVREKMHLLCVRNERRRELLLCSLKHRCISVSDMAALYDLYLWQIFLLLTLSDDECAALTSPSFWLSCIPLHLSCRAKHLFCLFQKINNPRS